MNSCTWLILLVTIMASLSGSVPWGLIIVRHLKKIDVRTVGSGNIGATNVRRAAGTSAAVAVLLLDILKGALPVLVACWLAVPLCGLQGQWAGALASLAAVSGHMFPVFLMFRPSGKGVATALGCFLILSPLAASSALVVYGVIVAITQKSSLGSLAGCIVLVPAVWISTHNGILTLGALIIAGLIILRHQENIKRLLQGNEPSLKDHSKRH